MTQDPSAAGPADGPTPPLFAPPSAYRPATADRTATGDGTATADRTAAADGTPRDGGPDASPAGPAAPAATDGTVPDAVPDAAGPPAAGPVPTAGPLPVPATAAPHAPARAAVRRRRRRHLPVTWVVPVVVASLGAGFAGGVLGARSASDDRIPDAGLPTAGTSAQPVDRSPESVAGVAAGVLPSVVSIEVETADGVGSGSGFVLRQDGYVLTNNHVVSGAGDDEVVVLLSDGSEHAARVVGATAEYDLAVLKIDVTGLVPLALGDSDAIVVGDPVVAVGAPLGLVGTVTTGIVSALNRPVVAGDQTEQAFINAIQTDAAINPGNSGGPLVNAAGEVVGINSAIAQPPGRLTGASGSIGLGFAIPSNQARRTAEQLIETGAATYPVIGVLLDERYSGEGVQVYVEDPPDTEAVVAGGPADLAGVRRGDVILAIDGRPVTAPAELIVAIRAREPGDTVVLRVRTGGDERDVRVQLQERAAQ